jgi:predicted RNA-binding Zn-ribbon protein involved in translation (DUF1610 family)
METYPRTWMGFEKQFPTEEACRLYLDPLRWPNGFRCPRCGNAEAWRMGRGLWLCGRGRRPTSATVGTLFERSRLPWSLCFRVMWHVTNQKNGTRALTMQRLLGLGRYQTAWAWLHKRRRAMARPGRDHRAGVVEADERSVGGEKPGQRGRGAQGKALVLLAVQLQPGDTIGRIRLRQVPDASGRSLVPALTTMVTAGSAIRTDGWGGYHELAAKGY